MYESPSPPSSQPKGSRLTTENWDAMVGHTRQFHEGPYQYRSILGQSRRLNAPTPGSVLEHTYFELTDILQMGQSANAYKLVSSGDGGYSLPSIDREAIVVFDANGQFRGRAKDAYASPHSNGSRGMAVWLAEVWQIVQMQPAALMWKGIVDVSAGAVFATVMQPAGGLVVGFDPVNSNVISNPLSLNYDEDDTVVLVPDDSTPGGTWAWMVLSASCDALT